MGTPPRQRRWYAVELWVSVTCLTAVSVGCAAAAGTPPRPCRWFGFTAVSAGCAAATGTPPCPCRWSGFTAVSAGCAAAMGTPPRQRRWYAVELWVSVTCLTAVSVGCAAAAGTPPRPCRWFGFTAVSAGCAAATGTPPCPCRWSGFTAVSAGCAAATGTPPRQRRWCAGVPLREQTVTASRTLAARATALSTRRVVHPAGLLESVNAGATQADGNMSDAATPLRTGPKCNATCGSSSGAFGVCERWSHSSTRAPVRRWSEVTELSQGDK